MKSELEKTRNVMEEIHGRNAGFAIRLPAAAARTTMIGTTARHSNPAGTSCTGADRHPDTNDRPRRARGGGADRRRHDAVVRRRPFLRPRRDRRRSSRPWSEPGTAPSALKRPRSPPSPNPRWRRRCTGRARGRWHICRKAGDCADREGSPGGCRLGGTGRRDLAGASCADGPDVNWASQKHLNWIGAHQKQGTLATLETDTFVAQAEREGVHGRGYHRLRRSRKERVPAA